MISHHVVPAARAGESVKRILAVSGRYLLAIEEWRGWRVMASLRHGPDMLTLYLRPPNSSCYVRM